MLDTPVLQKQASQGEQSLSRNSRKQASLGEQSLSRDSGNQASLQFSYKEGYWQYISGKVVQNGLSCQTQRSLKHHNSQTVRARELKF